MPLTTACPSAFAFAVFDANRDPETVRVLTWMSRVPIAFAPPEPPVAVAELPLKTELVMVVVVPPVLTPPVPSVNPPVTPMLVAVFPVTFDPAIVRSP
jgi:hypothetical protein